MWESSFPSGKQEEYPGALWRMFRALQGTFILFESLRIFWLALHLLQGL